MHPIVRMYLYSLIPAGLAIVGCVALIWKVGVVLVTDDCHIERGKSVITAATTVIVIVALCLLFGGIAAGAAALDAMKPGCP